jgi:hypothetical protein
MINQNQISSNLHMIYVFSNNDIHPVTKDLHSISLHMSTLHFFAFKLHPTSLQFTTLLYTSLLST